MKAGLVIAALAAIAPASAAGLDAWKGVWKGACRLTPAHDGIAQFAASLTIAGGVGDGRLRWRLQYEIGGGDVRDYEIATVDEAAGHYAIDEKNGLVLDAVLSDGVLYAPFTINAMLITATYAVGADGTMIANMPAFGDEPVRETCLTGQPQTCARSFLLKSTQHCTLNRVEMRKLE